MSTSFIRKRSDTLFLSSSSCSCDLFLKIENNQFLILYSCVLRVTTAIVLYMDDTLSEEDVLIIFDELDVQNSPLLISFL